MEGQTYESPKFSKQSNITNIEVIELRRHINMLLNLTMSV